jgi:REP element-mobilizing transposase RayT
MGRKSSAVYNITYHIVWCPKFRKPILVGRVKEFVEEQLETIAQTKGYKILEARVMPDHIHLLYISIAGAVRHLIKRAEEETCEPVQNCCQFLRTTETTGLVRW